MSEHEKHQETGAKPDGPALEKPNAGQSREAAQQVDEQGHMSNGVTASHSARGLPAKATHGVNTGDGMGLVHEHGGHEMHAREMDAGHGNMEHANMDSAHGGHAGHNSGGHMGHMGNLKQKFWVSLALAILILILSPMMGLTLPFQFTFPGSDWVVLILSTVLYFYGGMPFLQGAKNELKEKSPAMMTLISLGITTAYFYSLYAFIMNRLAAGRSHIMDFFWELATLIVIMLLGHWIEIKAVAGAGDALHKMAELLPSKASVRQPDGSFTEVLLQELTVGQIVMVKADEKIPADGTIMEGTISVNESLVTGESRDVAKKTGDKVIGGSLNGSGSVLVRVEGTGESGYLAQVMQLVGSAQAEKSRSETLSGKIARLLFYVALGAGILTLIVWYILSGDFGTAVTRMVTVLVIACPHALGLAIPLVVARSVSLGARNGLLVRSRQSLETATKVDYVMMDKTGTLTVGDFKVTSVKSLDKAHKDDDILSIMAGLETGSSHPLAASIIKELTARSLKPAIVSNVTNLPA